MKKYKIGAGFLSLTLACSLVMPVSAEDYSNTEAWYAKCSQAQTSESGIKACQGFQEYQKNRRQDLQKNIESYNSSIASLQNDTSKMEKLAKEQKDLVANLQTQISEKEKSIELIEKNIEELDDKIEAKESEIEAWNDQIEMRMKNEQTTIGTNMIIDLIMGSDSLSDMLRRISGVERITEDDQSQIKKLNKLKKELVLQQDEQNGANSTPQ
jgi:peptidoglycan hydrolase CwlO-like protein